MNNLGDKGARSISEMLQVNTTLSSLNLGCQERGGNTAKKKNEW